MNELLNKLVCDAVPTVFAVPNPPRRITSNRQQPKEISSLAPNETAKEPFNYYYYIQQWMLLNGTVCAARHTTVSMMTHVQERERRVNLLLREAQSTRQWTQNDIVESIGNDASMAWQPNDDDARLSRLV